MEQRINNSVLLAEGHKVVPRLTDNCDTDNFISSNSDRVNMILLTKNFFKSSANLAGFLKLVSFNRFAAA